MIYMKLFLTMHFKTLLLFTIITMQCLGQAKKDSSIIFREHLTGGAYNVVFIESNKESRFYKKILNIPSMVPHTETISLVRDTFAIPIKRFGLKLIAKEWYPLYLYKNKYYLYFPSDPGETKWIKITDSIISELHFDPGVVESIITEVNKNKEVIDIVFINRVEGRTRLKVHVIDSKNEIAVFEKVDSAQSIFTLMVAVDKIKQHPILVNYCIDSRVNEWNFDKIDFKKILRERKIK